MADKKITQLPAASARVGDEMQEAARLSSTITVTLDTISAQASDRSFNDSAEGFISAGFAINQNVNISGCGESANNIYSGTITALTIGKMTIGGADGAVIVDESAGATITITAWESVRFSDTTPSPRVEMTGTALSVSAYGSRTQYKDISSGSVTLTDSLADGDVLDLRLDGSGPVTFPSGTVFPGGTAPALDSSGATFLRFSKAGSTLYGLLESISPATTTGLSITRVYHVGSESWMYDSIYDAISAIVGGTAPSWKDEAVIVMWPGYYEDTVSWEIPAWTHAVAAYPRTVRLQNDTTDLWTCGGYNIFSGFTVEGSPTAGLVAFNGNDKSSIRIDDVDMLSNAMTAKQKFLKQSGANWTTLLVNRCMVDGRQLSGYSCLLENTAAAARMVDTHFTGCFFDALSLTGYGGSWRIVGCQDVNIKSCIPTRGAATYNTGVRLELGGVTGTPEVNISMSTFEGAVAIYNASGTHVTLLNSDAPGSIFAGTSTVRNSYTA